MQSGSSHFRSDCHQNFHWPLDKKSRMGCKSAPAIHALLTRLEVLYFDAWRFFLASLKALKALRRIDLWNRVRTLASATPNLKGRNAFTFLGCSETFFCRTYQFPSSKHSHDYILYSYERSLYGYEFPSLLGYDCELFKSDPPWIRHSPFAFW